MPTRSIIMSGPLHTWFGKRNPATGQYYNASAIQSATLSYTAKDGTQLLPTSAMAYQASLKGYTKDWPAVTQGKGVSITISNQSLRAPDSPSLNPTVAMTAGGWYRFNSYPTTSYFGLLFKSNHYILQLYINKQVNFTAYSQNSNTYNVSVPAGIIQLNVWHFIVGWVDTVAGTINIQVDNGTVYSSAFVNLIAVLPSKPFIIGADLTDTGFLADYTADSVFFFSRVLNSSERSILYNNGVALPYANLPVAFLNESTATFVSWWDLDEATGATRLDARGQNDLTDSGTSNVTQVAGLAPAASIFNQRTGGTGYGAGFTAANPQSLNATINPSLQPGSSFTVGGWFKFNTIPNMNQSLFSNHDGFFVIGQTNYLTFTIFSSTGLQKNVTSAGFIQVGQWYFIVCWNDASGPTWNAQINNGGIMSIPSFTSMFQASLPFRLGSDPTNGFASHNGLSDSCFFFQRALNSAERSTLYNNGVALSYSQLPTALQNESLSTFVSWWDLEEPQGTVRTDARGQNSLTDSNGNVAQVPGNQGVPVNTYTPRNIVYSFVQPTTTQPRALVPDEVTPIDVSDRTGFTVATVQDKTGYTLTAAEESAIAAALLDLTAGVETNMTVRQALRIMLSALGGKLSGAAGPTVSVRDTNDTKNRIVATTDNIGNRTAVTLDPS